jgi:hypothetical protein
LNKSGKLVAKVDRTCLLVIIEEVGDRGVEGTGGLIVVMARARMELSTEVSTQPLVA